MFSFQKLMNFLTATALVTVFGLSAGWTAPSIAGNESASRADSGETNTYIVRLEEAPAALYRGGEAGLMATSREARGKDRFDAQAPEVQSYRSHLQQRQEAVLDDIARLTGQSHQPQRRWQLAVNGFALEMDAATAARVHRLPGVAQVKQEIEYVPQTFAGPKYINAKPLWDGSVAPELETKGEGMVVAIVDSGILPTHESFRAEADDGYLHQNPLGSGNFIGVCDPSHPDYDPSYQCNDKLIGAFVINGSNAFDDNGHGTHVAGTAAGNPVTTPNGTPLSGVAPRANIINYKVCDGGCVGMPDVAEDILERGIVDVVNYSIGPGAGGGNPYGEASAWAFRALNESGVMVFAAAGNSGPAAETVSNFAPWNVTVGSSHHGGAFGQTFSVTGPGDVPTELENQTAVAAAEFDLSSDLSAELGFAGDFGDELACESLANGSLDGMIAVTIRGECSFVQKAENLADAGAVGMLVKNNEPGDPIVMGGDGFVLPSVMVSQANGNALLDFMDVAREPQGVIFAEEGVVFLGGDVMSNFSSRGPGNNAYTVLPGPDLVAPGQSIQAAYVGGDNAYNTIGGTSMASPHAAGAGALLKALNPDWSPTELQSAMMMTARRDVLVNGGNDARAADIFDQGAGRLDLARAAQAGLIMDESTANFEAANPNGGSLALYELNVPFLTQLECGNGECSWERQFKAVRDADWRASSEGDVEVAVSPSQFSVQAGETITLNFTAAMVPSSEEWHFGNVLLQEQSGPIESEQHLPVAVTGKPGDPPPPEPPVDGEDLDLSGLEVPGGEANLVELQLAPQAGEVSGFSWVLDYQTNGDAWQDEFRMEVVAPDGSRMRVAGAEGSFQASPDEVVDHVLGWPEEEGRATDEATVDDFNGIEAEGTWSIRLWGTYGIDLHGVLQGDSAISIQLDGEEEGTQPPSFSPSGGAFEEGESVEVELTVADAADDVVIHYTVDGSRPDRDSGNAIDSGDAIVITHDTVLQAMAFQPDGDSESDSEVVEATFDFYPPLNVVDGDGSPVGDVTVTPGGTAAFSASGGGGDYFASASPNLISGQEGEVNMDGADGTFQAPSTGAFAGSYEVTVEDAETGWRETFTVVVGLQVESDTDSILDGDSSEVRVLGAVPAYGFSFHVEDQEGMSSSVAVVDPEEAEAEDNEAAANPARTLVTVTQANGEQPFQLRVSPQDGQYDEVSQNLVALEGHRYSGWVTNELGDYLSGATVATLEEVGPEPRRYETVTDEDGVFSLITPSPDAGEEHTLLVAADDFEDAEFSGAPCVGSSPQCTLTLTQATASIQGEILGMAADESLTLVLVAEDQGGDWLERSPVTVVADEAGQALFHLDTNHTIFYPELRFDGLGYETGAVDNEGEGFRFDASGDEIEGVEITAEPTTPAIEATELDSVGASSATLLAEIDPRGRSTVVSLAYGVSEDDLSEEADPQELEPGESVETLAFELDGLPCELTLYHQFTVSNDRDRESQSEIGSFTTAACDDDDDDDDEGGDDGDDGGDDDGGGSSCSLSATAGAVDPSLPMLLVFALLALIGRRALR